MNLKDIKTELVRIQATSTCALVQDKAAKAISKLRTAETLIEQAERTLVWARNYKP